MKPTISFYPMLRGKSLRYWSLMWLHLGRRRLHYCPDVLELQARVVGRAPLGAFAGWWGPWPSSSASSLKLHCCRFLQGYVDVRGIFLLIR